MKAPLAVGIVLWVGSTLYAQASLIEPPEFPKSFPGAEAVHPGDGGCFLLASGAVVPGDVDWLQVAIPVESAQTIVDLDFVSTAGESVLLALVSGGVTIFNIEDGNGTTDDVCGLGSSSTPVGSPLDSVADLGPTVAGAVVNIGITGGSDTGFRGNHGQDFAYDVWVYVELGPCNSDAECDDGEFCNGVEICLYGVCTNGLDPCPGQLCGEDSQACVAEEITLPLDIRPGACPNKFVLRGRGVVTAALVGTVDYDITSVDTSQLRLFRADGVGGSVAPLNGQRGPRVVFEDLATPLPGWPCDCGDANGDGFADLLMKFRRHEVIDALQLHDADPTGLVELVVSGTFLDGTPFTSSDCIELKRH
ncbi:MAG: hypothetical protein ACYSVY_09325 [Planctomycetota bacterium]|jgi:hypothetical protein